MEEFKWENKRIGEKTQTLNQSLNLGLSKTTHNHHEKQPQTIVMEQRLRGIGLITEHEYSVLQENTKLGVRLITEYEYGIIQVTLKTYLFLFNKRRRKKTPYQ